MKNKFIWISLIILVTLVGSAFATDFTVDNILWSGVSTDSVDYNMHKSGTLADGGGIVGTAINLDGTDDKITLPQQIATDIIDADAFTISAWVNPDVVSGNQWIMRWGSGGNFLGYSSFIIQPDGTIRCFLGYDGSAPDSVSTATLSAGSWQHVVCTYDGTDIKTYVGGSHDGTGNAPNPTWASTSDVYLGSDGSSGWINGRIDQVQIYDTDIGATAISTLYASGSPDGTEDPDPTNKIADISFEPMWTESYPVEQGYFYNYKTIATSGKIDSARYCDGTGNYIEADLDGSNLNGDFSVSMWLYPETDASTNKPFFAINPDGTGDILYAKIRSDHSNEIQLFMTPDSGSTYLLLYSGTGGEITENAWNHVVFTFDDSTDDITFYIDNSKFTGTESGTATNFDFSGNKPKMGVGQEDFLGKIDQVLIFDDVLSDSEVSTLYAGNSPTGDELLTDSNLKWYSKLDNVPYELTPYGGLLYDASEEAFDFDGTDDYMEMDESQTLQNANGWTVSVWAKFDHISTTTTGHVLLSKNQAGSNNDFNLYNRESKIYLFADDGTSSYSIDNILTDTSTYHHYVGTYDGTNTMTLYIDGAYVDDVTTGDIDIISAGKNWEVGSDRGGEEFDGQLSDINFWDKELSLAEVTELYGKDRNYNAYGEPPAPEVTEFLITSNIDVFNATINGTLELGTTNGTINTGLLSNATSLFNIVLYPDEYNSRTYANYNVSTNLYHNFTYFSITSNVNNFNATVNSTLDLGTTNGTINTFLLTDASAFFNIVLQPDKYYSKVFSNYNVSTDLDYNFTSFNVTAEDYYTNDTINNFDILISNVEHGQYYKNSTQSLATSGSLVRDKNWQEFTSESNYLEYVTLELSKTGTATNLFPVSLIDYDTNITIKTVYLSNSNITTEWEEYNISFNQTITNGKKYWLKIASGTTAPDYLHIRTATSGSFPDGDFTNIMYNSITYPVTNENWFYNLVGGEQTYNTTTGNIPVFMDETLANITIFSDGYLIYSNATHNTSYNLTTQLRNYTGNITFIDSNTSLPINGSNVTIYYPSGASINKVTDANGIVFFDAFYNNSNELGVYNFQFDRKLGYITPLNFTEDINYTSVPYNNTYEIDPAFINITIKDVQTGSLITDLATVTISGVGQYNTTTGNIIVRDTSIAPNNYTMSTFVTGYDLNLVTFEYTSLIEKRLTVSMANETGENIGDWIVTVLDPFYNTIINADTRLLEYDSVNDSYIQIDSCITNANGRCVYSVEVGIKMYLVTASKNVNGDTYTASSSIEGEIIYFDQDEVDIFLDVTTDYYIDDELELHIGYVNDTLVNSTGGTYLANMSYLTADFEDDNNNSHTVCVDYYYLNGLVKTHATGKCITGSAGLVYVSSGKLLPRTYTWIAEISVVQDGGYKKVFESFRYNKLNSFENKYELYVKYIIALGVLIVLGASLYLRNIMIFPIGMIALTIVMTILLPSYFDIKIFSILLFLELVLIFLSRKQDGGQIV